MASRPGRLGVGLGGAVLVLVAGCNPAGGEGREPASSAQTETESGSPEASVAAEPEPTPTPTGPPLLLPNVRSLPPEDVQLRFSDSGQRELRFAGILANVGDGPLIMTPDEERECPAGQRHASQVIRHDGNDDGQFSPRQDTGRETRPAGCLLFHPDHDHWHLDASARYAVHRPGEQDPIVEQNKVSFCLRDSRRLAGEQWANEPERYGECERDRIQGISVGWGDVYDADLAGQALVLPDDLADGIYCLRVDADPLDLMHELDETDNSSVVGVRITSDDATEVRAPDRC